ncbi:MAG: MFS transporter, partial [Rhodopirellula sp.]|nr:MFS transporter [Rhodopirellula sp.]
SLAVAEKTIRLDLDISEETMGFIMGPAFFWSYALFQIPGGWLGKRFGSRTWLPIFSALSAGATMLFGMATGVFGLLSARIGIGVAQAGLFPCSTIAITKWFPRGERGITSGFLGAAMSVGGAIGAAFTGELLEITSWRWTLILYSVPGLLWAVGFRRWFRETPAEHSDANEAECQYIRDAGDTPMQSPLASHAEPASSRLDGSWLFLVTRWSFWLICGQQFFRAAGYAFFSSWFATYLQESRGVSTAKSGWLLTLPLIATVVAAILGGGTSDFVYRRTGRLTLARSGLAGSSLFLCALLVFSAWFVQDATVATIVISAGAFCAAVAGPCAYASTMDMGGKNVALVFSWMNMIGNFGAGLLPWIVPRFRTLVEDTAALNKLCGGNSWNAVLILFGAMFLLASLCWALLQIRENELEA